MPPLPQTHTVVQIQKTGGPEVLEVTSAPLPKTADDQILVKNTYAGINFIDTYFRTGLYPPDKFPYLLGREGEGHVVAVGPKAETSFQPGDNVVYLGVESQAEFTAVNPAKAVKIPEGVEPGVSAAALIQGLTALTMIRESYSVQPGDAILVHAAAGGVGLWLLQLLRIAGAKKIIATASTQKKLELARKNGATHTINYKETEGWATKVLEFTKEEEGVHAVFDGVGKSTFEGDLQVLRRKGTLVSYGNASGAVPPFVINRLSAKNLKILRPQLFAYVHTKEEFDSYTTELLGLIEKKQVNVAIHKVYPLAEVAQAQKDLEARVTTGKLLLGI